MKLVLKRASYSFRSGQRPAVRPVSFEFSQGERIAILGESGSGKSTLVSMMAGLIPPTAGQVVLGDSSISAVPPYLRMIGYVPQRPPAIPGTSVRKLIFRPALRDNEPDEARRLVQSVAASIGMSQLLDRSLRDLSGGELQRAFVGRLLVWRPHFMLLDEPLGNIDIERRRQIYPLIVEHAAKAHSGLLLVTHDPNEATILCDRVMVMTNGAVIADASVATMLDEPPHLHAASLFGGIHQNRIEGQLSSGSSGSLLLRTELGDVQGVFQSKKTELALPVQVSFFVRPDQLKVVTPAPSRKACTLIRAGQWNSNPVWVDISASPPFWVSANADPSGNAFKLDLMKQDVNIYEQSSGGLLGKFIGS